MPQGDAGIAQETSVPRRGRIASGSFGLTAPQLRIWLDCRLSGTDRWANFGDTLEVSGPLDVAQLRRALGHVVQETAALRLQLVANGSLPPAQRLAPEISFEVPLIDLTSRRSEAEVQAWLQAEHQRTFVLSGPLFRFAILQLAPELFLISAVIHHCCLDGYGLSLVWRRVAAAYGALMKGELPRSERDDRGYRAHARAELMRRERAATSQRPEAAPPASDENIEVTLSSAPASHLPRSGPVRASRTLSARVAARVNDVAATLGVRSSRLMIGAVVLYVSRFTGLTEFPLLLPMHGRREPRERGLAAMCTSTTPVRFTIGDTGRVSAVLMALRSQIDEASKRARTPTPIPFDRQRSLSGHGIGISINFVDFAPPDSLGGLAVRAGSYQSLGPINDLEILLDWRNSTAPRLELWANSHRYTEAELEAHVSRMAHWIDTLLAQPHAPVCEQPTMEDVERDRILNTWNDTARTYAAPAGLHQLFEAQVARSPHAVASVCGEVQLTYQELNERSNQLAHYLRARGVGPDIVVGLLLQRSHSMIIGMLGILKAGGAYLPLEPGEPRERREFMLRDAHVNIVVTQGAFAKSFGASGVDTVDLDAGLPDLDAQPRDDPALATDPLQLAYVIYTSGSTGMPKGAMNVHGAIVNRICWMQERYALSDRDRVLQKTPFTFDVSVWELFWPLAFGGQLVFGQPGGHKDPEYLMRAIERFGITLIHFVPSMLKELIPRLTLDRCRTLRDTFCSGEALPGALASAFVTRSSSRLHNLYGPTEAAVDVSAQAYDGALRSGAVSIGTPIANLRLYVLDRRLEPCACGMPGELFIGGVGLARGYLARPGLTAERFIAAPFGPPGSRLYRTGDEARYLPNGALEFIRRLDHQVKIRGLRVELGEIEAALRTHPDIDEVVVVARQDRVGDQMLVAYFTAEDQSIEAAALREHLRGRLRDYMLPGAFVRLTRLPLTASGKLDRRALPEPDDAAYGARAFEPPQTPMEQELAAVWREVLPGRTVGRHDDFFALGGNSLSATRVMERLHRRGLTVDLADIFRCSTLAQLATAVRKVAPAAETRHDSVPPGCTRLTPEMFPLVPLSQPQLDRIAASVAGGAGNVQDIYPLTSLQEGMLFHHFMSRRGDPYLQHSWITCRNRESAEQLARAMQRVVQRHDMLRSAFVMEGGRPLHVVWREVSWAVEEFSEAIGLDAEAALRTRFDPATYRLDVRQAPVMRVYLVHDVARDRWLMLWLIHHLICDWISMYALIDELHAIVAGREHELPAPWPFRRFLAHARSEAADPAHKEFFSTMLGTFTRPTIPPHSAPGQPGHEAQSAQATVLVDGEVARRVHESSRKLGVSVAAVCHLAHALALSEVCGQEDVVFGTVLFGRAHADSGLTGAVGLLVNTLPVRIQVNDRPVQEAANETNALLTELLQHEHASLSAAQRCSGLPASAPLISVLLNYRHARKRSASVAGFEVLQIEGHTNYPVLTWIDDDEETLLVGAQIAAGPAPEYWCALVCHALEAVATALEHTPGAALAVLVQQIATRQLDARASAAG